MPFLKKQEEEKRERGEQVYLFYFCIYSLSFLEWISRHCIWLARELSVGKQVASNKEGETGQDLS